MPILERSETIAELFVRLENVTGERDRAEDRAKLLQARRQALIEFVAKWVHDGALQTFEDRERFRLEARNALRQAAPYDVFCSMPEKCAISA